MTSRCLNFIFLILLLGIAACSKQEEIIPEKVVKPYVTNAEYALEAITKNKTSAVAFQVKPIRSTACEYMYLEFGKKNAEGKWDITNAVFPGKNSLDNFGQDKLEDQIHFAEVNGVGEFGIIALGCKPYDRKMKAYRGLFATFDVEYGRLNYIGEISLIPKGKKFATFEVADRTEFAKEQIQARLSTLEQYFQENIIEKNEIKITPELKAKVEKFNKKQAELKEIFEAQRKVAIEHDAFYAHLKSWEADKGYPHKELSEPLERERKNKRSEHSYLRKKVYLYKQFVEEGRSLAYVEKYILLYDNVEKHRKILRAKYSGSLTFSEYKLTDPEKKRLQGNYANALEALAKFKKNNP